MAEPGNQSPPHKALEIFRDVIRLEAQALSNLTENLSDDFSRAIEMLLDCKGKVVLTGVGKSGLIARKISATMNSTGTVSTFLHPSDAMHGDLGILSGDDVIIAIGKSGESEELTQMLPSLRSLGTKIIAVTANASSTLAKKADLVLLTPVAREACPHDLAPTVSTTLALAVGDALAMALMELKGFKPEDFAKYHPGGKLGKRLLLKVSDIMIPREKCAVLDPRTAKVEDVITALSECALGIVLFSEDKKKLSGVLTDGDIRRLLNRHKSRIFDITLEEFINRRPITTDSAMRAVDVLQIMEDRKVPLNVIPIVDDGALMGVVRLHELLSVS